MLKVFEAFAGYGSQLYKQAGNSIVVAVLEAIFRNMFLEVPDEDLLGEHIQLI